MPRTSFQAPAGQGAHVEPAHAIAAGLQSDGGHVGMQQHGNIRRRAQPVAVAGAEIRRATEALQRVAAEIGALEALDHRPAAVAKGAPRRYSGNPRPRTGDLPADKTAAMPRARSASRCAARNRALRSQSGRAACSARPRWWWCRRIGAGDIDPGGCAAARRLPCPRTEPGCRALPRSHPTRAAALRYWCRETAARC